MLRIFTLSFTGSTSLKNNFIKAFLCNVVLHEMYARDKARGGEELCSPPEVRAATVIRLFKLLTPWNQ